MSEQTFFYDEFFLDDEDEGVDEVLKIGKREVPIKLHRGLTLEAIQAAQAKAVRTKLNKAGVTEIVSIDEQEFTAQVLAKAIKSWPFTYRNGKPVPITLEVLRRMYVEGAEALGGVVAKILNGRKEQLAPFVKNSDVVSS